MTDKDRQDEDMGVEEFVLRWGDRPVCPRGRREGWRCVGFVRHRPGIGAVVAMVAASKATVRDMIDAAAREDGADEQLLRRLIQSRAWRWMPGIVLRNGRIVSDVRPAGEDVWMTLASGQMSTATMFVPAHGSSMWQSHQDGAPIVDIEHPATKGAMREMVRVASGDIAGATVFHSRSTGQWLVLVGVEDEGSSHATEGEALARAIIRLGEREGQR